MSLNIKNPRTHALVRELASVLQVSQTEAVTFAVEELLRQEQQEDNKRLAAIRRTGDQIRRHTKEPPAAKDALYDKEGLFV